MKSKEDKSWYKLDNSAVIYPMSTTITTQSLFRLSVELKTYIDDEILLKTIKKILPRFPSFKVMLRSGFFLHFFEANDLPPVIKEDNGILFQKIDYTKNNQYLFRISFFRNKIFVDFFHGLCDGMGGMEFFKSLIYQYLMDTTDELIDHGDIKIIGENINEGELEDGFSKYYRPVNLFNGVVGKMAGKNAFAIKGRKFKSIGYGLIQGTIDTTKLKEIADKYDCTVTTYLSALMLLSVAENAGKDIQNYDLTAMVPVNLRAFFPSETLRNFTSLIKVYIKPNTTHKDLYSYCNEIKVQLKRELDKDSLLDKMSVSSIFVKKWYAKYLPLFVKTFILKTAKLLSFNTKQTAIVTNLGLIKLPEGMEKYVEKFGFCPNVSRKVPCNMGIVSYNGKTVISFTRKVVSNAIERTFFEYLMKEGADVEVVSNFRETTKD